MALTMSKILGLDMVGIDSNYATDSIHREGVILRMERKNSIADYCPYLIVSDNMNWHSFELQTSCIDFAFLIHLPII